MQLNTNQVKKYPYLDVILDIFQIKSNILSNVVVRKNILINLTIRE